MCVGPDDVRLGVLALELVGLLPSLAREPLGPLQHKDVVFMCEVAWRPFPGFASVASVSGYQTFGRVPALVRPLHGRVGLAGRREPNEGEVFREVLFFFCDLPEERLRVYLGEVYNDVCLRCLSVRTRSKFVKNSVMSTAI